MVGGLVAGMGASVGIGLSLGLVGAGGSILTVPILVYLLGVEPSDAVGVSLAVVATTSLLGALLQYRAGLVETKSALLFGAVGVVGALAGSRLTPLLSPQSLMLAFAVLMVVASVLMLLGREPGHAARPSLLKAGLAGLGTGALTGFLGVGGGFVVVPALVFFAGLPARTAMGTSLAVIAVNSLTGLAGALSQGHFDLPIAAAVSGAAALGMLLGASLSRKMSPRTLRRGFAVVSLAVAGYVLVRSAILPL